MANKSMTGKSPEYVANAYRAQREAYCAMRVRVGDMDKSKAYWERHYGSPPSLPYPECLKEYLATLEQKSADPGPAVILATADGALAPTIDKIAESIHSANGWPLETTGEVMRKCINKSIVVLRIADGRQCSMLQARVRPWRVGARVKVKLTKFEGDPLYKAY